LQPPIGAPDAMRQSARIAVPESKAATDRGRSPLRYHVLYRFHRPPDSAYPGGLVDVSDALYGEASGGGAYNVGTVFSMTTGGTEKVLHSFGYGTDGQYPGGGLVDVKGTLYGTTYGGGAYGEGTVFSMTTGGTENVLYSFGHHGSDGQNPNAGLVDVKGTLYGTTELGGANDNYGTVFRIAPTGKEKVLYSFAGGSDGIEPDAGLINVNGTLYGTTFSGDRYSGGTVYSISTTGTEKVLHGFGRATGSDGANPVASLINVKGTLYGTTRYGGGSPCLGSDIRCGTVFSVTTAGTEEVLHAFDGGTDGNFPSASLINVNGRLYGTANFGGDHKCLEGLGCGTVFALTP
jgi:uncharacterized repeat protein (TIGR03803 family)